ncbi:LLM class flavin-dependent oxidoreductase [Kibdelosporangium phytohabitans]|uniref:5,10-methylene tetrahydromethanopterin reductase n=1 Tax=Kibdelosporangium phytohabitans TaxID=860235 RepID=A0A0N9I505_9PSEU|nr:LLM class flavin-dependent oxidoreductase [Kibdelosporangium phytohabitans]ALG09734.1 5,10-methylene tetrahydromethanopterin reductase [Kibdelosporangium phytohabitans]MBE1468901.1 alkanesulfonate monooxygenase SsuD/methylene tetrahydromethanopterin reductase-like flavin-dependent oxidoreductase (luciferase family) [Kibdelosporangium phytohabitans]
MVDLQFGFSLTPSIDFAAHDDLVGAAEEGGLDLVGVQDHPYVPTFVDTFSLIATMLARTTRLRFFPDVLTLPLRPPAMLAKASTSLDLLSGGRFELGIGAGGVWDAITGMGVERLGARQALDALEEAIQILRALWMPDRSVRVRGKYYTLDGTSSGPVPAHPISIWVGAQGPRSLRLTGRMADGWAAPIPSYLHYEKWAEANSVIDEAARAAGRRPEDVLRMSQLVGTITETEGDAEARTGAAPVRGTPDQWARLIARLATEQPFRSFVFWPERQNVKQIELFAREVVPAARALAGQVR